MTTYRFDLICPACNKQSETVGDKRVPPPGVYCGDCLMDRVEIVEMKVLRVEVQPA
jgi:hypothetical protein